MKIVGGEKGIAGNKLFDRGSRKISDYFRRREEERKAIIWMSWNAKRNHTVNYFPKILLYFV